MRRALLLLAAAASLTARAQQDPDTPYARIQVPGRDVCISWSDRRYTYTPDAAGSAITPAETEFAAIDAAYGTWQAASDTCSDFAFIKGGRMVNTVFGYDRQSSSNNNVLVFREVACRDVVPAADPCFEDDSCSNAYHCWDHGDYTIALTVTTFTSRTGTILDADIELNGSPHVDGTRFLFTAVNSPPCEPGFERVDCVATDIQNTLTHELGHAVGLGHVSGLDSTMLPTAPVGETHKRIIDAGTRQGFCAIYPPGLPAADCFATGQISPTIVATNRGTPGPFGCAALPAPEALAVAAGVLCLLGRRRRR